MPTRERTVLVVASGLAFAVVASILSYVVWREIAEPDGGWFAYAPNTGVQFDGSGSGTSTEGAAFAAGAIWLAAIAIWASVALRIYRAPFDGERRIGRQPAGS